MTQPCSILRCDQGALSGIPPSSSCRLLLPDLGARQNPGVPVHHRGSLPPLLLDPPRAQPLWSPGLDLVLGVSTANILLVV